MQRHTEAGIRPACPDDEPEVLALLQGAGLPVEGLADHWGDGYAVAESGSRVVGAAGVEVHGAHGLLRSVVVSPAWRGRGLGERLVRDRVAWARARRLRSVVLLTTTAAGYFPRLGFAPTPRADVPVALQASAEFAHVCPASARVFTLDLAEPSALC